MRRNISTLTLMSCVLLGAFASTASAAWTRKLQLNAPGLRPGTSGVQFGSDVAIDLVKDSNAVRALYVGAPNVTVTRNNVVYPQAGVVYVFVPGASGWELNTTLEPLLVQANAHFGASVAVHRGVIAVGQPDFDNQTHTDAGRIALFEDFRWNTPNLPPFFSTIRDIGYTLDNAHLGASVAVNGDGIRNGGNGAWIAGGAPGTVGAGCAYLYYLSDQPQYSQKGSACGSSSGDLFGTSVGVRSLGSAQMFLVVGAIGESSTAGAAHVYIINNANLLEIDELQAPNPSILDVFGTSIAIDAGRIYIGASGRDKPGVGRTGSVSLFKPAALLGYDFEIELFPSSDANAGDLCGDSIHLNEAGTAGFVVGCPGSNAQSNDEGFARVVEPIPFLGGTIWIDQVLRMASLPHGVDNLGRSVVWAGDTVYVGAPLSDDNAGSDNGAVQVFATDVIFINGFEN